MKFLRQYEEGNYLVTEFTTNGIDVNHTTRVLQVESSETEVIPYEPKPSLEEMQAQTLLNTEMLLIYKEIETGV